MEEVKEMEMSELVRDYLEPIPGDNPAGIDASNEEEYFKLNMEIPKTVPDYAKCIEYSGIILKEKSKDIKVASWLCFALFRTEKIKGLRDGLNIINQLLIKYGNQLYPENDMHRSKALQFLNTARFYKLIEREEINISNAEDIIEAGEILAQIVNESKKLFQENIPVMKSIKDTIDEHVETAKSLISPPPAPEEKIPEERKESAEVNRNITEEIPRETVVPKVAAPPPAEIKLASEKDALKQLRQAILFFFEKEIDGNKKEQVPENPYVFGLSRQLQWGRLMKPPDTDKTTLVEGPNQVIQNKIKEWFAAENWDTLIPRIEIEFLKADSGFPYWLDAQRYVAQALERKGGILVQASHEIKMHLSGLLKRLPDLTKLKFKDKQTPFAVNETVKWIEDEVKPVSGGGSGCSIIMPPILGEDYEPITKQFEAVCAELPDKFEENLDEMQKGIMTDDLRKGKFLRRLNLANYCFAAKQYNMSKINLAELSKLIDEYNLSEWEPALCTAVWQSIFLTNAKIMNDTDDEEYKSQIKKEQSELFSKIVKYNGKLALKLTNNK